MRKALAIACLPFLLSGCDAVLGIDNFQACLDQVEASFPEASGISDSDFSGDIEGFGEVDDYGNFEYQLRETSDEVRVGCKGNQSDRTLLEITFEGDTKMPSSMKQWSY